MGVTSLVTGLLKFFVCWYKFRKAEGCFNDFGVGVVKWVWSFSSWDSKICCILRMNFQIEADFLHTDSDAIIFD